MSQFHVVGQKVVARIHAKRIVCRCKKLKCNNTENCNKYFNSRKDVDSIFAIVGQLELQKT